MNHSKAVHPKPHRKYSPPWKAIPKVLANGEEIELKHFKPIKALGSGDTGSVHLVELCETGHYFAMKAMDKNVMLNRNKVHRACAEREILDVLDHPFLPALYASFQTKTHICLITDYYPGGELFILLYREPTKVLKEDAVRSHSGTRISSLSRKLSVRKVKLVLLTGGILEFSCMKCFYGYTPFRGKTRQKTFANILHKDLKFRRRKEVSVQGKQLMYRLPTRDPKNRLGSREEANEVKQHPFFRCINWALVRCMYPPKLDSPLFDENEKEVDPGLDELQKHF